MKKVKVLTAILAMFMMVSFANAQTKKHSTKEPSTIYVETGKMKLKAGVADEQFMAIEKNIREAHILSGRNSPDRFKNQSQ